MGWNSVEEFKELMDNKETTRQACYISIPKSTNLENTKNYKIDVMDYSKTIFRNGINELRLTDSNEVKSITNSINTNNKKQTTSVSRSVKRIWNITEDFANLIGMWLGDCHIKKKKTGGKIVGIGFTVHDINIKEIEFIKKTCAETFGFAVTSHKPKGRNVLQITVNSRMIGIIFDELFGSYFNGKHLSDMIFSWPKNLVNSLCAGLITTDGHIMKKKNNASLGL